MSKKMNEVAQDNQGEEIEVVEQVVNSEPLSEQQAQQILEIDYKSEIEDLKDKVLRAMAEAQNTRRRADIDVQNAKNFGIQSFAKDLLGVVDNLFRASETIPDADASNDPRLKSIKEGIEITKREMINVMERNGIRRIEPLNELFDPNLHQAMSQIQSDNFEPGTVVQVMQSGYILKDRLLRPALVVVAKGGE
jgi:molecular chaperone GrpE